MKQSELTNRIMKSVVRFEKKRIAWTVKVSIAALSIFLLGGAGLILVIAWDMVSYQTFDLFMLFLEDTEIVREYWRDSLWVMWQELPKENIFFLFILLGFFIFVAHRTRRLRQNVETRMKNLAKYAKKV